MNITTNITHIPGPTHDIFSTLIDVTDGELLPTDAQTESDLTDEELHSHYLSAIITLFVPGGERAALIAFKNDITNVAQHFEFRSAIPHYDDQL
jgi:hypothetical protein